MADTFYTPTHHAPFSFKAPGNFAKTAIERFRHSIAVWKERQTLGMLDQSLLDDIGVSEEAAMAERERSAFDLPPMRRYF